MNTLNNIWENYTNEFSFAQKVVIGVILGFVFFVALLALVLVILEIAA